MFYSLQMDTSSAMYIVSSVNMADTLSETSSLDSATFDDSDLLSSAVTDDITAQLASAGLFTLKCLIQC